MFEEQIPRRVVPRWRRSAVTAETSEAWTKPPATAINFSDELAVKVAEFESAKTIPVAAELMFLAREAGDLAAAKQGARLIIQHADKISTSQLLQLARKIINSDDEYKIISSSNDFVREARKLLAIDFRNPVLLMDIALTLTSRHQDTSALRYVKAAIAMAPTSRFVVRTAARYYLHIGDHETAHNILRRTPLINRDRWVQASEIAIASVRGKTSTLVKQSIRSLSKDKNIPSDSSELASAVATVELLSGAEKSAKKLFQKALLQPNDNSLAQVEWAASRLKLIVDEAALRTPLSFEANSNNAYRRLQIEDAIGFTKRWRDDEPFSSRPLDGLCYLYCLEGRYQEARAAAEAAIKADGGQNLALHLNLLFTKIQSGDVDFALDELMRLASHPEASSYTAHMLANAGALAYASEEADLGREFYSRAINAARMRHEPHTEALARAFFARAAVLSADPSAENVVVESATAVEKLPNPGAIYIMRTLVDEDRKLLLEKRASARVARRKWEWDAATNTLSTLN